MDTHPHSPSPDNYDAIISFMESTGHSASMRDMMADVSREIHEKLASIDDGLGSPTISRFTIREVAELTGMKRHTIRKLIEEGKIQARLSVDGRLWFIPREEVRKLMPDRTNEDDRRDSNEEETTEPYYQ